MPIVSIDPTTGETIKSFEELTDPEIDGKLARAADTYRNYRRTTFKERSERMIQAAHIIEQKKKELGETMTIEMGKPIKVAIAEAEKCACVCRFYAENAERFLADELVETNESRSFVRYQPI